MIFKAALCVLLLGVLCDAKKSFRGDRVFRLKISDEDQVKYLQMMRDEALLDIDFWTDPSHKRETIVHIPLKYEAQFLEILDERNVIYESVIEDLQSKIDEELVENQKQMESQSEIVGVYARHGQINSWLDSMAERYPNLAKVVSSGRSFEGRDMKVIQISSNGGGSRPIIWLDSGIHAREWIAPAVGIYIINELLSKYGSSQDVTDFLDKYDIHVLPSANPDGYEFSHDEDRLWRKTRSTGSFCRGADPNRNFDAAWGTTGISRNPCSDTYCGTSPFSEAETSNMRDYIKANINRMKVYFSLHSFTQLLLTPYSFENLRPENADEIDRLGRLSVDAIYNTHGKRYRLGNPPSLLYACSGSSMDWAVFEGIKLAYTYELRPARGSFDGFILPASEIRPTGEEVWNGIKAIVMNIQD